MSENSKNNHGKTQDKPYDLRRFRMLILEDSGFISNLFSGVLKNLGVGTVITAQSVAVAKELIKKFNEDDDEIDIDVIMTDWLLPDGMGLDFIKWIRDHPRDSVRFLPTIVCSAYASADLVGLSRNCGATEVMVKPVSAEKIAQRILYVIDKQRPFIQASDFFGPDRRRREMEYSGENRRVLKPENVEMHHE